MKSGEAFVLSFTHSVNKRPVYDTLRVEGDHLVIVKSRFDAFGAGMPETTTGDGELSVGKDGWMEWKVNRPVPEITVRVGRIADHILDIRGKQIHLSDLARGGSALTFRVRYGYFLDMLKGRCMT